jgi:hypothetical protein
MLSTYRKSFAPLIEMKEPKDRLMDILSAQRYSVEMRSILDRCDVYYTNGILRIHTDKATARHHGHFLVCDVGSETGLPVALYVRED